MELAGPFGIMPQGLWHPGKGANRIALFDKERCTKQISDVWEWQTSADLCLC